MKRYGVPCLAFINKLDRAGANPFKVIDQLRENSVTMRSDANSYGTENEHAGVIDLVDMKAYFFDGSNGENIRIEAIPEEFMERAKEYRGFYSTRFQCFQTKSPS